MADCWGQEDYCQILESVKNYLWLYLKDANIRELRNAVENITLLNDKDIDYLTVVHFLLSEEVVELIKSLQLILRRISHSTTQQLVKNKGHIIGRIDWNLTIKERSREGFDRSLFVCKPPTKIYNLPENQLLKLVLIEINNLMIRSLREIEEKQLKLEDQQRWKNKISAIKFSVKNTLKHVYFKEIDEHKVANAQMIRRARNSRNKNYSKVIKVHSLFKRIIKERDRDTLRGIIENRVFEPLDWDRLYEIYVLFNIIESLGIPDVLNLIKSDANEIASFFVDGKRINLYFQKVSGLLNSSKYKQIFEDYDLDVNLRRPDIIIEKEGAILFVEIKRTSDRAYIVDSVYKVLGYLNDYVQSFADQQKPKAIMVVWNISRIKESEQDVIVLPYDDIKAIKSIVKALP